MSQDFASLGINIESTSVVTSTANMHKMADAADKLEKSVIQLSQRTIDALEKEKRAHQSHLTQVLSIIAEQTSASERMTKQAEEYSRQANLRQINDLQYRLQKEEAAIRESYARRAAEYNKLFALTSSTTGGLAGGAALGRSSAELEARQAELGKIRIAREQKEADHVLAIKENELRKKAAAEKAFYEASTAVAEYHSRRQIELLEQQKFATDAKYNSDKVMYENLFGAVNKADIAEQKRLAQLANSAQKQNHFNLMLERTLSIITAMAAYRTLSFTLAIPEKILETNVELESLKVQLEGIMGTATKAKVEFERMLALDVKTPFDIEGLTQTMIMLKNYGLEPTNMVMTTLTDTVSKLGGSTETLIGIGRQLGQAWAKDKLQQMDMRPMIENGLPVISLLSKALHKTSGEILDMSQAGTLGRREMLLLFEAMRDDAPNASARSMHTMFGAISNVKTAWQQLQDTFLQLKSENYLREVFESWSTILFALKDRIDSMNTSAQGMLDLRQKINRGQQYLNMQKEHPLLAPVIASFSYGIDSTTQEELDKLLDKQFRINKQKEIELRIGKELKTEGENKLAADAEALALNEKAQTNKLKQLDEEAKLQKSIITTTNAAIDAQIKDVERLTVVKTDAIEEERKANDRLYEEHKISGNTHLTKELELIDKLTQVKKTSLQEQLNLQRNKLDEQVQSVEKAYEAIRLIETTGDGKGQVNTTSVNYDKWAIGKGQTQLATLRNPGYGMAAYSDMESIDKIKGKTTELVEYVKSHEEELAKWGEQYYKQLVIFYGKQGLSLSDAIQAATKKYGDGTDGYMEKFNKINSELTGESVKRIKLGEQEKEIEAEIAKVVTEATIAKQDAKHKLNSTINAALDQQIDKYKQLTMSEQQYYEFELQKQGFTPQQIAPASEQFAKNKHEEFRQKEIEDATRTLEEYGNKVDTVSQKYSDLGSVTSAVFDGALGGVNILAGSFDNLIKSIGNTRIEQEKLNKTRSELDKFTPDASKGQDEFIKQIKIRDNAEAKYAKDVIAMNQQITVDRLAGARQISGAIAGMLNKNTTEYKAAHAIEMALAGAELAVQVMKIAGIGAVTAANVESVVPYVGATMVKAEADATAAVASQAKAGPYIGFALMAAMAVAMAGLGLMGGKGGSTSPGPQNLSSDTGTLLGDPKGKSESIDKTYQLLKDIHAEEYAELRGINRGIASLSDGITGVVTRLFQAGGIKDFATLPTGKLTGISGMLTSIDPINKAGFDPIGKAVLGFLFGGKQTSTVIAQGISTGATSIADIMAGGDLSARQFATIETKTKGGLFGKNKTSYSEQFAALDEATQESLNKVFGSMGSTMLGLAESIGHDTKQKVENYIIPAMRVDLNGLSGEDAAKKLNGVISASLDTMSTAVFGSIIGKYQKLGEGMLETAVRVVSEVAVVKDALSKSGLSIAGDAIALSDALVQAAGGLQEFQKAFDNYYQKFYTEAEHTFYLQKNLSSQLGDLNTILPATRDGYRKLVESLNINNAADAERYSLLIKLSGAADEYYKGLEAAAEAALQISKQQRSLDIQIMELSGNTIGALTEKRKDELAAMDESLRFSQQAVWAMAKANEAVTKATSDMTKSISNLSTLASKLRSTIEAITIDSDNQLRQDRLQANAVLNYALTVAQSGGSIENIPGMDKALKDIAKPAERLYSTMFDYARDQGRTANVIGELAVYADSQVSIAQQQLDAINGVKDSVLTLAQALEIRAQTMQAIETANLAIKTEKDAKATSDSAAAQAEKSTQALNDILAKAGRAAQDAQYAKINANALSNFAPAPTTWVNGQTNNPIWEKVLGEFNAWHTAYSGKPMNRAWGSDAESWNAYQGLVAKYNAMSSAAAQAAQASAAGLANVANATAALIPSYQQTAAVDQTTAAQAASQYATAKAYADAAKAAVPNINGFASGGDHAGGWRIVGENGPELEYTPPSHIYSNSQSKSLVDNSDLIAEIRALRNEVAMLRASNDETARNTRKTSDTLTRVTRDGDAVVTTV